ncbi:unnamed protein product [Prorocentrum cordatum]|uniref:Uncharacterized protein n=1 Tax=Prorocentrum cordatum TaxID=2364126 RepID=A0ABN9QK04_9DINO|nr:unnamed protein product [Polarella glacialis]
MAGLPIVAHNPNAYNKKDCGDEPCMGNCAENMRKMDGSILNIPGPGNGQSMCWRKSFRCDHLRVAAVMVQIQTESGLTRNQTLEAQMAELEGCPIYTIVTDHGVSPPGSPQELFEFLHGVIKAMRSAM